MRKGLLIGTFVVATLIPSGAMAEPDGLSFDFVMTGCREFVQGIRNFRSAGYCAGFAVGVAVADPNICPPATGTLGETVHVVVQYIDARPARHHEGFAKLATEALRETWPCR